eukprot:m.87500 g.87500  ORF g.87500 m.87500 type:complete len:127 (-) comp50979_c0_seq1:401-781(-)
MVDLEDRSYYHGRISRDEAVDRLTRQGRDGSFLLRMSETQDGVYTISVMQGQAVRHIRVINVAGRGTLLSSSDLRQDFVATQLQQLFLLIDCRWVHSDAWRSSGSVSLGADSQSTKPHSHQFVQQL